MTARQQAELLQQHDLSAAFPSMPEQELQVLALDIEKNGQREPGVMYEGKVLDGWHRYLGCQAANVPFKAIEFDGEDPVAFVKSKNWHRRHLTASQKAAAEVALHEWADSGQRKGAPGASLKGEPGASFKTNAEMAKDAGVSERTIQHAKAAHDAGLGGAVREGKVSAKRAAEVAQLPPSRREKALSGKAKKPKVVAASPDVERLYAEVKDKLVEVTEQRDELAETARELEDKLTAFEKTEPDEQQKEIMRLQKRVVKLEAEVARLTVARNDAQAKNNELIREVKRLRKRG
jgi:hypothetical protein